MQSWPAPTRSRLPGRGLPLRVSDTATRSVRPLAAGQTARMYVCGITPYDATHLGHAFTYLTYDLAHRVLLDAGHDVVYVQNVTDVDDPLFERARRDGLDWREIARSQTDLFRADMAALRILPPAVYAGAVESIPLVIEMIEQLRARGAAYQVEQDIYFPIGAAPRFGEVSHLSHAEMVTRAAGGGGDPQRLGKKDPLDPLLWRAERAGEPAWPSPFGPGRPGWHIECAAIALAHLGDSIDIQGGGTDLVFPHHECGVAHAEVASGVWPFARAYVHTAMVSLDGHKMSKSRGNLEFVSRLLRGGIQPAAIRLALLDHHHAVGWEWTPAVIDTAGERLDRWQAATARERGPDARPLLDDVRRHLADDLDAPGAVAAVDRWATTTVTVGGQDPDAPGLARAIIDSLLGIDLDPVVP
ncbi:cysteine--1-D-myo-inosityl 2-amino-2-deoxy-alpha-D-glucopyranoside ligase [Protofrankia symbiont of Coriaria ruscifolia]|uniref:L-cysteine:1D-myo-inositol 2-amino-2-deoxy-alpha-D-glucopyranoside ligase n=1 Tax=Candidatus Protofrankia californiensis TaxID=1839754 RepID=A0A1C3P026_9ACTN|nr:cysteine--1-D-myo-inosityl 2-amino-2-deoxy-alpha-D-glucopyranoside ligase [Protofrankia symbiont of Coriaria ruscifolia]SBW23130.1 L-cysteine:1D-myo-inositol 2-amino-2-deoxy-alpha-D-glucopyranoside ligase [Candidatus Protofrankia californiensis]